MTDKRLAYLELFHSLDLLYDDMAAAFDISRACAVTAAAHAASRLRCAKTAREWEEQLVSQASQRQRIRPNDAGWHQDHPPVLLLSQEFV